MFNLEIFINHNQAFECQLVIQAHELDMLTKATIISADGTILYKLNLHSGDNIFVIDNENIESIDVRIDTANQSLLRRISLNQRVVE